MKIRSLLLLPVFLLASIGVVFGQEEANEAPQILSTDLTLKQIVQEETLTVSFIILDEDPIIEVMINDEPIPINQGKTIVIDRAFVFKPGKTVIRVTAMDAAGNVREKQYLVGYQIADADAFMAEDEKKKKSDFFWKASFGVAMETDSNPTSDPGLPFEIPDITLGVIPDSDQPDVRTSINGTFVAGYGKLVGYTGFANTAYQKSANAYLGSLAIFFGGGYTISLSKNVSVGLNALFLDINVGGADYSQNIGFSPTITFKSEDEEGFYTDSLIADFTTINFAKTTLTSGSEIAFKWKYVSLDPEKLDSYNRVYAFGSSSSGSADSEYSYAAFDYDWKNKWESGFKWNLGFGFEYKTYATAAPLIPGVSDTRLDFPIRISTGMGWAFNNDWNLMYNFKYTLNLSTGSPNYKILQGIKFNGAF